MRDAITVRIQKLPNAEGLALPDYATELSAGMDLIAALPEDGPITLAPGAFEMIPLGIAIELPPGYEAQVRPRSGLAARNGVTTLNAPGTIDADYRGQIHAILINHGKEPFAVTRGLRVAQLIVAPVTKVAWAETEDLSDTERGSGGFGSTGLESTPDRNQNSAIKG